LLQAFAEVGGDGGIARQGSVPARRQGARSWRPANW
jgi:hypothetical protein